MNTDFDISKHWIDLLIIVSILYSIVSLFLSRKRKNKWETVNGIITYSTVEKYNFDTEDEVIYQFTYDGMLYEIKETFTYGNRPYGITKVTVFINPKDIFKSTITPPKAELEFIINGIIALAIFLGLLIYKIFLKVND